jgi:hydroxyacylglutathione hydrolase
MEIERFYTPGLAQVAYGIADERRRVAAIIDPRRDVGEYLRWASDHGYETVAILETHVHADFVSGARELAAATGAPVHAGRLGGTAFPHKPLDDGAMIDVGDLRLQALWTPGHTPEHIAYLLFNSTQGKGPAALFSGDALFSGEIGRPDLLGADQTSRLVDQLYETITERLTRLPDDLVVYPRHGAGSPCGKKIGDAAQTTIGQEKLVNYAFQTRSREEFARAVLEGMPKPPTYYPVLKRVNQSGAELLDRLSAGRPLSADDVAARQANGALVIDARPPSDFAAGHIPGSVSVGLGPSFPLWIGWLAPYERAVILVLPADDRYDVALTELRRIGIDRVDGYLTGGIAAWRTSDRFLETLDEMAIEAIASGVSTSDHELVVLDVRTPMEWEAGHIPGSRNAPAGDIAAGAEPDLGDAKRVAVICGSGYRSCIAASLMQQRGIPNVATVPGGMTGWNEAYLPTDVKGGRRKDEAAMLRRVVGPWQGQEGPTAEEISVDELARALAGTRPLLLDVRELEEWALGRIPGSIHIPMGEVASRLHELDAETPIVTVCRVGVRSLVSANELLLAGFGDVKSLAGGIVAWVEAGQPIER